MLPIVLRIPALAQVLSLCLWLPSLPLMRAGGGGGGHGIFTAAITTAVGGGGNGYCGSRGGGTSAHKRRPEWKN